MPPSGGVIISSERLSRPPLQYPITFYTCSIQNIWIIAAFLHSVQPHGFCIHVTLARCNPSNYPHFVPRGGGRIFLQPLCRVLSCLSLKIQRNERTFPLPGYFCSSKNVKWKFYPPSHHIPPSFGRGPQGCISLFAVRSRSFSPLTLLTLLISLGLSKKYSCFR